MPPVSYAVAAPPMRAPQAGDVRALERVLGEPLTPPTRFVASLPTGTLPTRLPRWPWLLWIAVALLPLDVWLHRRSRAEPAPAPSGEQIRRHPLVVSLWRLVHRSCSCAATPFIGRRIVAHARRGHRLDPRACRWRS